MSMNHHTNIHDEYFLLRRASMQLSLIQLISQARIMHLHSSQKHLELYRYSASSCYTVAAPVNEEDA